MVYEFVCSSCATRFDVIRQVVDYDKPHACIRCNEWATRTPFPRRVYLNNTAVQEKTYNPAFGKAVTDREAKQLAREKGMIEVGNEDVNKHVNPIETSYDDVWQGA